MMTVTLVVSVAGWALTLMASGAYTSAPACQCSPQDSLALLPPTDSAFTEAEALKQILAREGFAVHCVIRSVFASFGEVIGSRREATFRTDRGDLTVLFFPGPNGAERVEVREESLDSGWRYTFPGARRADDPRSDTMYAARRHHFVKVRRWFIVVNDATLAADLRRALQ